MSFAVSFPYDVLLQILKETSASMLLLKVNSSSSEYVNFLLLLFAQARSRSRGWTDCWLATVTLAKNSVRYRSLFTDLPDTVIVQTYGPNLR